MSAALLADGLATAGLLTAAACVRMNIRALAPIVAGELAARRMAAPTRAVYTAMVDAWGAGDDARVGAAMEAWEACGCEACALAALRGRGRCAEHEGDG